MREEAPSRKRERSPVNQESEADAPSADERSRRYDDDQWVSRPVKSKGSWRILWVRPWVDTRDILRGSVDPAEVADVTPGEGEELLTGVMDFLGPRALDFLEAYNGVCGRLDREEEKERRWHRGRRGKEDSERKSARYGERGDKSKKQLVAEGLQRRRKLWGSLMTWAMKGGGDSVGKVWNEKDPSGGAQGVSNNAKEILETHTAKAVPVVEVAPKPSGDRMDGNSTEERGAMLGTAAMFTETQRFGKDLWAEVMGSWPGAAKVQLAAPQDQGVRDGVLGDRVGVGTMVSHRGDGRRSSGGGSEQQCSADVVPEVTLPPSKVKLLHALVSHYVSIMGSLGLRAWISSLRAPARDVVWNMCANMSKVGSIRGRGGDRSSSDVGDSRTSAKSLPRDGGGTGGATTGFSPARSSGGKKHGEGEAADECPENLWNAGRPMTSELGRNMRKLKERGGHLYVSSNLQATGVTGVTGIDGKHEIDGTEGMTESMTESMTEGMAGGVMNGVTNGVAEGDAEGGVCAEAGRKYGCQEKYWVEGPEDGVGVRVWRTGTEERELVSDSEDEVREQNARVSQMAREIEWAAELHNRGSERYRGTRVPLYVWSRLRKELQWRRACRGSRVTGRRSGVRGRVETQFDEWRELKGGVDPTQTGTGGEECGPAWSVSGTQGDRSSPTGDAEVDEDDGQPEVSPAVWSVGLIPSTTPWVREAKAIRAKLRDAETAADEAPLVKDLLKLESDLSLIHI